MGQEESKQSFTDRPLSMKATIRPKNPIVKASEIKKLVINANTYTFQLSIPDDTLTCGWLLSECIRLYTELEPSSTSQIVSLSTGRAEALDCWLLMYDRPLTPFKNNDKIILIFGEPIGEVMSLTNFLPLKIIGKGGFSNVTAVRKKDTGMLYAIKTMEKDFVINEEKIPQIMTEKEILTHMQHPFIVTIHWAFQSKKQLHLVLELCPGGELFYHLHNLGRFTEDQAKFYFAEVILALEYLHNLNIIYRDLKPENILLDIDGHIRITDFGLSKQHIGKYDKSYSICGSPEYMAPEMLSSGEHGPSVDFYTLGALLFELLTGLPPFYDKSRSKMRWKILNEDLEIPNFISNHGKSLLSGLLNRNPEGRLGYNGVEEIKSHSFCKTIDWHQIYNKKIKPPLRPHLRNSNFDPEYKTLRVDNDYFSIPEYDDTHFEGFEYSIDQIYENRFPNSVSNVSGYHMNSLGKIEVKCGALITQEMMKQVYSQSWLEKTNFNN